MKIDKDILAVWPLAAMEAGHTGWENIEPYHFLCGALKFAEIDARELAGILRIETDTDTLVQLRDKFTNMLAGQWKIEIPQGSSAFRRALRKPGTAKNIAQGEMMHRSKASRRLFEAAADKAVGLKKKTVDLCDLINVLLQGNDKWIIETMKKLGLPLNPNGAKSLEQKTPAWKDVVTILAPEKGKCEPPGGPSPAAVVINDRLCEPAPKERLPCLLINDSSKMGKEILQDSLNLTASMDWSNPTVCFIQFNFFYEKMFNREGKFEQAFFDSLLKTQDMSRFYFFNSFSNYLSDRLMPQQFVQSFVRWFKQVDGRFVFEISLKKYNEFIKDAKGFKDRFHLIFLTDPIVIPEQLKL